MIPQISSQLYLYFILILIGGSGFFFTLNLPHPEGFFAFICVSALAGFGVSFNIWHTKHSKKHLVCPTGSNCEAVTGSKYARFLNIPLHYWGMAYFLLIIILYIVRIFAPSIFSPMGILITTLLSLGAGLFSLYLLFVQAFLLRQWCIWCILTAPLSLTIAITSLASTASFIAILAEFSAVLVFLKHLGFVFGVGSAVSASFLFFHFLDDSVINEKESDAIKSVSEIVWLGLGLVLISTFALIVIYPEMIGSAFVTVQVSALLVSGIAGAALMIIYHPFMTYIPFGDTDNNSLLSSFGRIRKITLITGSIAFASWFFAFLAEFLAEMNLSELFGLYGVTLLMSLSLALMWEKSME